MGADVSRDTIDAKGRLAIPAGARKAAGKSAWFMLVPGFEGCLALYDDVQWTRVEERLQRLGWGRKERAFKRALLLHAVRVTVDAQGRVTIPPALMSRAGLGKEATLHGVGDHIEIWNPDRLGAVIKEAQANFEANAEDVLGEPNE